MGETIKNNHHSFLKFFIVVLILGGLGFAGFKVFDYINQKNNNINGTVSNNEGNPILLTRSATTADFSLKEDVEATILNLKDTYEIIPFVDINSLKIKMIFMNESNGIVKETSSSLGNVSKGVTYSFSISHSVSDIFNIKKIFLFSYWWNGIILVYLE